MLFYKYEINKGVLIMDKNEILKKSKNEGSDERV